MHKYGSSLYSEESAAGSRPHNGFEVPRSLFAKEEALHVNNHEMTYMPNSDSGFQPNFRDITSTAYQQDARPFLAHGGMNGLGGPYNTDGFNLRPVAEEPINGEMDEPNAMNLVHPANRGLDAIRGSHITNNASIFGPTGANAVALGPRLRLPLEPRSQLEGFPSMASPQANTMSHQERTSMKPLKLL